MIEINDHMWTIRPRNEVNLKLVNHFENFLTPEELEQLNTSLQKYRENLNEASVHEISNNEDGQIKYSSVVNSKVRRTKVEFLDYYDESLRWFYEKLAFTVEQINNIHYKYNLTGIESLQLGSYHSTDLGHYSWHLDSTNGLTWNNNVRKLSFSLLLSEQNEDFEDGNLEFKFGNEPYRPAIKKNTIVFFPSYILHRVSPVTMGVRESIVGWVNGPNWV